MNIRLRGLLSLIGGGAAFGLIAFWVAHPEKYPFSAYPSGPGGAILIGVPGAVAIIGLVELTTGRSLRELEDTWASLNAWRKFLLGTLIVIVGGAVAFTAVGFMVA